ncbi:MULTISPECIES: L,D-transpeptidase [unclassified Pseudobutyrivibrio]|uniref:L,D-transpeptidase n=1 Tax=unclassified Pseudobutyrivibrio TaxID=2638619 RepID=UPI000678BBBF|nr:MULTISPECIES: L,D-transpeptidase [unclassified Pseudobutyrivibrio]SET35071.1 L,D-transpeptidase catalytic domain [Pseudobutyrivibrio sp. C4]
MFFRHKKSFIAITLVLSLFFSIRSTSIEAKAATPYALYVNRVANVVTVMSLDAQGQYTIPVKAYLCSVGANIEDTPTGSFTTSNYYEWRELFGNSYGRYAIRFNGHILFHSVPYAAPTVNSLRGTQFNMLGQGASQGCVRMAVGDLKWIYDNCKAGTPVIVYDDAANPGPLGRPAAVKLDVNAGLIGYDPTEEAAYNPWMNLVPTQYLKQDSGDGIIHGYVGMDAEALKQFIGARYSDGTEVDNWNYSIQINGNYNPNVSGTYVVWIKVADNRGYTSVEKQYTIQL